MSHFDLVTVSLKEISNIQFGLLNSSEIVRIILIYILNLETAICRW